MQCQNCIRENKKKCDNDALMPKYSAAMYLACLTKTHLTHAVKLNEHFDALPDIQAQHDECCSAPQNLIWQQPMHEAAEFLFLLLVLLFRTDKDDSRQCSKQDSGKPDAIPASCHAERAILLHMRASAPLTPVIAD